MGTQAHERTCATRVLGTGRVLLLARGTIGRVMIRFLLCSVGCELLDGLRRRALRAAKLEVGPTAEPSPSASQIAPAPGSVRGEQIFSA